MEIVVISYAYYNYGCMYNAILDFENELKYYHLALNYLTDQNEYGVRLQVLHSDIASIYHSLNKMDSAEYHFRIADSLFQKGLTEGSEYDFEYASRELYLGRFFLANNKVDSALNRCQSAYEYFKSLNSNYNTINCILCLLEGYELQSDAQKINEYYKELESLSKLADDSYIDFLIADYKFREIERDIDTSHTQIIKDYIILKDSLNIADIRTKILKKENQHKLTIKQQELLFNRKQLQVEKRTKYLYLCLFIISLIGLLLTWQYLNIKTKLHEKIAEQYQNQKYLQKTEIINKEKELLLVNKEKEFLEQKLSASERTLILKLMMRKKFLNILSSLKIKLESISIKEDIPSIKALASVFNIIGNFEKSEQTDKEFMLHFDKIHPEFYTRLKTEHPNLNLNDQKLCAYIKMNMSAKEISQLLNIHPSSVNTSRYRLRMKLKLSKNSNLNAYIQGL